MGAHGTITEQKKEEIRTLQTKYGIQESARRAQVSYYTAWCVFHKKYSQPHLQPLTHNQYKTCPITGFRL